MHQHLLVDDPGYDVIVGRAGFLEGLSSGEMQGANVHWGTFRRGVPCDTLRGEGGNRVEKYVAQLLDAILSATENVVWPYRQEGRDIRDWISDEEEERTAPRRQLEQWTGIRKVELPPVDRLTDDQVERLLVALKAMLDAHNWSFVLQIAARE